MNDNEIETLVEAVSPPKPNDPDVYHRWVVRQIALADAIKLCERYGLKVERVNQSGDHRASPAS